MITIDGKQYRNLEEQVLKNKQDIAAHYSVQRVLADFGIKIIGQVPEWQDPVGTFEYGDAYAVGTEAPYEIYIYTRADEASGHPEDYWLNIGPLAIQGPQGPEGPQGLKGDKGDTGVQGERGNIGPRGLQGEKGIDGTSVTITSINESTEDNGENTVTFSDGAVLVVKNGSRGKTGIYKGDEEPTDSDVDLWRTVAGFVTWQDFRQNMW